MDDRRRTDDEMDESRQVVGGVLPNQDDAGGNFSQTDPGGGPGDRPLIRPDRTAMTPDAGGDVGDSIGSASATPDQSSVAGTAGGGYGIGSGTGSSGGSPGGGENASAGPATDFVRGAPSSGTTEDRPWPSPDEPDDRGRPAAPGSMPPDATGE